MRKEKSKRRGASILSLPELNYLRGEGEEEERKRRGRGEEEERKRRGRGEEEERKRRGRGEEEERKRRGQRSQEEMKRRARGRKLVWGVLFSFLLLRGWN